MSNRPQPTRRQWLGRIAALALGGAPAARATGTPWREHPLRVILPFAAGGPGDVVLRALGERWQARHGQPLLIEHRGGASGTLGAAAAREAVPDGRTLLLATSDVLVNNTALFARLSYDPQRDFRPLAMIGPVPLVLVVPAATPATDVAAFAAGAAGRPIAYGSWGEGSHAHLLAATLLSQRLRLDAVHAPYRGLGPLMQDLMGGQIQVGVGVPPVVAPLVAQGRLRALAVTGETRSMALPEVPTLAEQGQHDPVFGLRQWAALMAPAATPGPLAVALEAELAAAFAHPATQQALRLAGFESGQADSAAAARARIAAEAAWVPARLRALGVTAQ